MSGTWSKLKKSLSFKQNPREFHRTDHANSQSSALTATASSSSSASSSSTISRFSRSFSTTRSSKKTCAICLGSLKSGHGQAIFTAECSHSFHFSCIADSVKHGNYLCPICRSKWKEIPFQWPNFCTDANCNNAGWAGASAHPAPLEHYSANHSGALIPSSLLHTEPLHFNDDEPLPTVTGDHMSSTSPFCLEKVTIKSFSEFPAVASSDSTSSFAVLIGVRAPPLLDNIHRLERAPIDLVTVLDISCSMAGSKLSLLKRAVHFVIENMGPCDRLSIVSFSSNAQRILPLRRMTANGCEDAKLAVNSLTSSGGTDIVEGLHKGVKVLEERRERNRVASIILLSDGHDTYNCDSPQLSSQNLTSENGSQVPEYLDSLPVSICPGNREPQNEHLQHSFPVHTFGFGTDHDSSAMHAISDASGGTFSFIESVEMVQDAFARCIGGLLSVVVQNVRLTVRSASAGVNIESIHSGRYSSEIFAEGKQGIIKIGDLYADEEKEFLVHVSIPAYSNAEDDGSMDMTALLYITCSYVDAVSKETVELNGEVVEIQRPTILSPADVIVNLEIDRHRNRVCAAESISKSKEMAEMGNLEGAQAVLTERRATLQASASGQAGDSLCTWLDAELMEIMGRMTSRELYDSTGRAYVLSGLSSHSWQRATTRGDSLTHMIMSREGETPNNSGVIAYDTPAMINMVSKSQNLRLDSALDQSPAN